MRALRGETGNLRKAGGATVLAVMIAALSVADAAKGPAPDILVKTTVFNSADTGALRVQSDGATQAVYETTTIGGKATVTSTIYSFTGTVGQDFFLTTYYSAKGGFAAGGRTLRLDMSDQRAAGFTPPNLGSGHVAVQVGVKCRLAVPSPVNLVGMASGQSVECPGSLRFWAPDGQWYRFSFQPENFSNSDYWKVTCTATGSQGCTKWTITPSGTDGTSVNTLLRIDKDGNILDVGGDYGLTYSFLVER